MADDPYKTLGVSKTATDAEIKKAYRKLVKEAHPDLNPGDSSAADRFKAISGAYDLLKDPEQRARFDRGEIDASGAERPHPGYYRDHAGADRGGRYHSSAGYEDFGDISDLFEEMLKRGAAGRGQNGGGNGGRSMRMRGSDLRFHLEIDFLDAVNGAKRRITLPDGGDLELTIPPGVTDGEALRLKGKGAPGLNDGPAGDALITLSVRPHPTFTREGDDIVVELPISIDEAVLGGKVEAPTVSGRVRVAIPKLSSSRDVLRLKGKGVRAKGRPAGDQRLVLKVVSPREADPELEACLKRWREKGRGDPRENLEEAS